jgi:hypothetical protein
MSIHHFLGITSLAFAIVACGGSNESAPPPASAPPAASSAQAPSASGGSPEGGECSDDVAIQKKCAPGLVCGPPKPGAPISEHTPGICKKP